MTKRTEKERRQETSNAVLGGENIAAIHGGLRNALGIADKPNELRWCVSAMVEGKMEYVETASKDFADAMEQALKDEGYDPCVQRLTREKIQELFGYPVWTSYCYANTEELAFTVIEGEGTIAVLSPGNN